MPPNQSRRRVLAVAGALLAAGVCGRGVYAAPRPAQGGERPGEAYLQTAVKAGQAYPYSCEFDAVWVILRTYGIMVDVDSIIARTHFDNTVTPGYRAVDDGIEITGGDIRRAFSGDYRASFLARSTGGAIAPVFASFGLFAAPVRDRAGVEGALTQGDLVWMKTTVDFRPWRPAVWVTPDGARLPTVLGNDHAVVAAGFNRDMVIIRDVLGPTSSNRERPLEYTVGWETFLACWAAQNNDGLAVARPRRPGRDCADEHSDAYAAGMCML